MRRTLIAGNWKMNTLPSEAGGWLDRLGQDVSGLVLDCDLLINVPATHLALMSGRPSAALVALGGQDLSRHDHGAYTGEISGAMLRDAGASFVIVGHSERRAFHHEDDEIVGAKVRAARRHGLVPILCVGESETQRDQGQAAEVVLAQLRGALSGLELRDAGELVVAYEPVWAIGTGRTATTSDAQEMCRIIRTELAVLLPGHADGIRILYGGSMNPGNSAELLSQQDIDGGLIGGASLKVDSLVSIARSA